MNAGWDMWPPAPTSAAIGRRSRLDASAIGPVSAVLIDLRGVIYDDTILCRWLFRLVSRMGVHLQYETFWETWQHVYERDVNCGKRDSVEALQSFLGNCGLTRGQIDETITASDSRRRQFEGSIRPLPGVKAALAQLDALGWLIGVLSNAPCDESTVKQRLHQLGLIAHIDVVLSSFQLAQQHPTTSRYACGVRAVRCQAEHIIFVSTQNHELLEAKAAGMIPVGLQLKGAHSAVANIEQLADLAAALRPVKSLSRAS